MKDWKNNFTTTFVFGALLLTGCAIALNMVFGNFSIGRFDLTSDQIYKLSPAVKTILSQLEAPIEITYYVSSSEKMPTQWKNLERDVIDKLEELKMASEGRLTYTVFDPSAEEEKEAFEEEKAEEDGDQPQITRKKIAERLFEKGVIPFGVQSTERDEFAIKRVYSSIVLSYLDRKEDVIEEVRPEGFGALEYEIMSRIYKLISNRRPKIGFFPSQPDVPPQMRQYYQQGPPPDMYAQTVEVLKSAGYDVTRTNIKKDDPIPEDITTMIVMVDQPLSERQLYEIDKLVHNGVRVILGTQMHNYQVQYMRPGEFDLRGMPTRSNLNDLVNNYGFEFDNKMFMDQNTAFIQVPVYNTRSMGMFQVREQRLEPVTKPVMIRVNSETINSKLSISNKISEIFYMYGTRLNINEDRMEGDTLDYKVLFTSSDVSWTRDGYGMGPVNTDTPSEENLLRRQPLGVLVEGTFNSRFAEGNIPKWGPAPGMPPDPSAADEDEEEEPDMPTELSGAGKPNKLIAFGCSNMFKSDMLQSIPSHRALLRNTVDALTLGDELINIRSKTISARRIKTVGPVGKGLAKAFVVWFSPLVLVGAGIYLTVRRKKR